MITIGDAMKRHAAGSCSTFLSNAIKFTGEGGKVTFSTAAHKKARGRATLRFIVNDTGIGISEEFIEHMFEPFAQESIGTTAVYGGTGLGLAISKNIVDNGWAEPSLFDLSRASGQNSRWTCSWVLQRRNYLVTTEKKVSPNFSALKTLVVDDDVAVCESAVATLKEIGVTAEWVGSGRKAIERVQALWEQADITI